MIDPAEGLGSKVLEATTGTGVDDTHVVVLVDSLKGAVTVLTTPADDTDPDGTSTNFLGS